MRHSNRLAAWGSALALALGGHDIASGQTVARTPPAPGHPMIGTWRIDVTSLKCFEVYEIRADGTTRVTSAQEVGESEFEISPQPSAKGFYKWVDRVTRNNGKPDCSGHTVPEGDVATNFIRMRPDRNEFLMCADESLNACLGPFVRSKGT